MYIYTRQKTILSLNVKRIYLSFALTATLVTAIIVTIEKNIFFFAILVSDDYQQTAERAYQY